MDYDAIRTWMSENIPLNGHLGLDITEMGDGSATVILPEREELKNHVGSQHAGALFTAAEAASGAAFAGAFAESMGDFTPLAKSASIDYVKIAKGPITASGTLPGDKTELLAELEADGRVEFPVEVSLTDTGGAEVARVTVRWHLRKNA